VLDEQPLLSSNWLRLSGQIVRSLPNYQLGLLLILEEAMPGKIEVEQGEYCFYKG
jgi:hypothetical protein